MEKREVLNKNTLFENMGKEEKLYSLKNLWANNKDLAEIEPRTIARINEKYLERDKNLVGMEVEEFRKSGIVIKWITIKKGAKRKTSFKVNYKIGTTLESEIINNKNVTKEEVNNMFKVLFEV